ncbi:hypothetical protein A1O1_03997 [Capronia coronata CBS 617.96]|uniref:FAD dependent oxidoreductase domain-containing protein n=1 Tax=Capronia coronata CBS 617.96 TaxID=1182541 RepID=W9YNV0_9EURO|nr:uncharacterized protein A1O1_03997 [Capronia coronata CBS 617.96]EXJ90891.1 hypothetical protein A1O1_03997 [Capronia coronata CBS 617.96]
MSLVIIGGGIVGLSIAYYSTLADPSRKVIIVDSEKSLFLSASGFSGGYIVRDWFSPSVLPLAELSFLLHRQLAEDHNGRKLWGYTPSNGYSLVMEQGPEAGGKKVRGEDWLLHGTSRAEVARTYVSRSLANSGSDKNVKRDSLLRPDGSPLWTNIPAGGVLEKISSPSGCAQVEPRQLCEWLLQRCEERGVEVHLGTKTVAFAKDSQGSIVGLHVQKHSAKTGQPIPEIIPCKDVVISGGCWTPRIFQTLVGEKMSIGIRPLPGYSIVVRSPRYNRPILEDDESAQQVETSHSIFYPPGPDWKYSPEAMARQTRDGRPEIFVAGLNNEAHLLPELAGGSKAMMEEPLMNDLKKTAFKLVSTQTGASAGDDLEIVREGLCFRPVSESGIPIISEVGDIKTKTGGRLYVASGHGPWGITLSLATGFVMSEVLQGKAPSVSLDDFKLKSESSFALRPRL